MAKRKRMKMRPVSNIKQAIEVLGGDDAVAAWLGTTPGNIVMMKVRGYVARGYHLHFYLTLRQRRYEPSPNIFGLANFDRLLMPNLRARKANSRKAA